MQIISEAHFDKIVDPKLMINNLEWHLNNIIYIYYSKIFGNHKQNKQLLSII